MVTTRRSAASQPRDTSNAASKSSDTANGSQTAGRRVARKSAPVVAISKYAKKRHRGNADTEEPLAKKPALGRPRKPRTPKAPPGDEHEDQVPDDPMFFEEINATASGKSSAKRRPKASQPGDGDIAAGEESLHEGQSRRKPAAVQENEDNAVQDLHEEETRSREESGLFVEQREADEDEVEAEEISSDEEHAEEREEEEEDGNSDDGLRAQETTSSAITDSSSTNKLEHITRIDRISADLAYIEPEPRGKTALIFSLNCDGFNPMIKAMGKQGWMNIKGEWTDELLIVEESETEWRSRHAQMMTASSCMELFLQTIALWKYCRAMPKAPVFDQQGEFLRSRSPSLENRLKAVQRSVELVLTDASKPVQSNPKQKKKKKAQRTKEQYQQARENRAEEKKAQQIFACIYSRLIPALVMALKEALLLGGYNRLYIDGQPETISVRDGMFMACTLQIALRIVGFIDQLYGVVLSALTVENESDSQPGTNTQQQQKQRMAFGKHLGVLKQRILEALKELKFRAEAPLRQAKVAEQTRLMRKAKEEAYQELMDAQRKQRMWFVVSTQRVAEELRWDKYYSKHGWYLREDEILLRMIRKTDKPDLEVLAGELPNRTLAEVKTRIRKLRDLMKAKYEAADIQPPKWCYY